MPRIILVGGVADGRVYEVPQDQIGLPFFVAVPPKMTPGFWRQTEEAPDELVAVERVEYIMLRYDSWTSTYVYGLHRPDLPLPGSGRYQWCRECDVKWWGDAVCWCCERTVTKPPPGRLF